MSTTPVKTHSVAIEAGPVDVRRLPEYEIAVRAHNADTILTKIAAYNLDYPRREVTHINVTLMGGGDEGDVTDAEFLFDSSRSGELENDRDRDRVEQWVIGRGGPYIKENGESVPSNARLYKVDKFLIEAIEGFANNLMDLADPDWASNCGGGKIVISLDGDMEFSHYPIDDSVKEWTHERFSLFPSADDSHTSQDDDAAAPRP